MRRINVSAAIGAPRLSRWRCDKKKNILYGKKKKKNPFSYVIYKRRAIRNNNNIKKDISTRSVLCVCVSLLALNKARCAPLPSCLMGPWSFSLYRPAHTQRKREPRVARAISPSVAAESRAQSHTHTQVLPWVQKFEEKEKGLGSIERGFRCRPVISGKQKNYFEFNSSV